MDRILGIIRDLFDKYTPIQRGVIAVVFIGMLSAIISLIIWANKPEYEILYTDLEPTIASKIVSELRSQKIKYRIEDNQKTILVPSDNVSELKLSLTELGYIGSAVSGYEVFDEQKIGMTSFMQKLNLRRALEGELVKTINQFPNVKNSRVHLVLPEGELFESEKIGSASVVLFLQPGKFLTDEQVKGIASLISNSVEDIPPEEVVVVDSDGNLLSEGFGEENTLDASGSKWELRQSIENKLQKKVKSILMGVVGIQNALVEVSVELNFEQLERTTEAYDPDNVVIISEERHLETSSNIDTSKNINEKYNNEDVLYNYELNKTVELFKSSSGEIKRLSVAVLVNGRTTVTQNAAGEDVEEYTPRTNVELDQLASLVKGAVGYNLARGDIVEVQNLEFDRSAIDADREYFAKAEKKANQEKYLEYGLITLGLIAAFFVIRALLKSSSKVLGLSGIESAAELAGVGKAAQLAEGGGKVQAEAEDAEDQLDEDTFMKKLSPEARAKLKAKDKMTDAVIKYAEENPEAVTQLLRSWLTGEKGR